jgi:hypothetical protein
VHGRDNEVSRRGLTIARFDPRDAEARPTRRLGVRQNQLHQAPKVMHSALMNEARQGRRRSAEALQLGRLANLREEWVATAVCQAPTALVATSAHDLSAETCPGQSVGAEAQWGFIRYPPIVVWGSAWLRSTRSRLVTSRGLLACGQRP